MTDQDNPDYAVGYRKPPKGRQFKPGQSGNPAGRPRAPRTMSGAIARLLGQKITIAVAGKSRRMSLIEALGRQATQQAASGDLGTLTKLIKVALSLDLASPLEPTAEELEAQEQWRGFEMFSFIDLLQLRELLIAANALCMDKLNRPVLTDGAVDRLFSPDFDPGERERLIKEYRLSVSLRRESDPVDWSRLAPIEDANVALGSGSRNEP
jgi:hypothetical protein